MFRKRSQIEELIKQTPALSRQFVCSTEENVQEGFDDPLEEDKFTPVKGLVHKYNHEVLVLLTLSCARYCRFCTRRRKTLSEQEELGMGDLKKMVEYIKSRPEVYEVIISGGDPLTRPELLKKALKLFSNLSRIKIIRVGTRLHFSDPAAVNNKVLDALKVVKKQPLYIMAHFEHPTELTKETVEAIKKLQKVSTMVLSQTVSLRGVNDDVEVLEKLFIKLTQIGVKPYYFLRCDPVKGAEYFIVDFEKERKIFTELRRRLNGLACPLYVIDAPGGFGKVPVPLDFWDFSADGYKDFKGKKIETPPPTSPSERGRQQYLETFDQKKHTWVDICHDVLNIENTVFGEKADPELSSFFQNSTTMAIFLREQKNNRIVGYIYAFPDNNDDPKTVAHVDSVALLPDYQGRGLVVELNHRLEEELLKKGYKFATMNVMIANGYAEKIAKNYADRIIESRDIISKYGHGPQRYFKIKLF